MKKVGHFLFVLKNTTRYQWVGLIFLQLLSAIEYLRGWYNRPARPVHEKKIAHRDLKPENFLFLSNDPKDPDYLTIKVALNLCRNR